MHKFTPNSRLSIHGITINALHRPTAESMIANRLASDDSGLPFTVFTPNAEMILRATQDPKLSNLLNSSDLNIPDGIGVVWASKKLGTPINERIPGIELGETAISECAAKGYRVFLLGGTEGTADRAAARLVEKHPSLIVCGAHHGYFAPDSEENEDLIKTIAASHPDLLIVCLGFPRQEEWIMTNRSRLTSIKVMMALGGSLDVWSGKTRRAPEIIRSLRLEWLWRIMKDPSRLPRAAALPAFVRLTLRTKHTQKAKYKANLS